MRVIGIDSDVEILTHKGWIAANRFKKGVLATINIEANPSHYQNGLFDWTKAKAINDNAIPHICLTWGLSVCSGTKIYAKITRKNIGFWGRTKTQTALIDPTLMLWDNARFLEQQGVELQFAGIAHAKSFKGV